MTAAPTPAPAAVRRRRLLIIHNETAGTTVRGRLADVVGALAAEGTEVMLMRPRNTTGTRDIVTSAGSVDAIVAAGGDGTLRSVADAVLTSPTPERPVGLVPLGTGNVMAREIGLGFDPVSIARVLATGPAVPIRASRANGATFLLMAGVGIDAAIVARLNQGVKRRVGRAAYAGPTLRSLADPLPDLSVTVDGTAHRAAWLVVTRARRYGGSFLIAHGADLRDENLIAVLFQAGSRSDLVRLQLALVYGSLERARGVLHLPCTRVSVRASTPVACQVDGDPFGRTPLTIEASGPNLRLIVPPAYEKCRPA